MRLVGYIKACKDFSFTIPIYKDRKGFYYHELDDKFIITDFIKIDLDQDYFLESDREYIYKIGDKAPIVFIGANGKLILENSKNAVVQICTYLDEAHPPKKYISEEVFYLADQIGCDIETFKNKFYLKHFVFSEYSIIYKDIINILNIIEEYIDGFKIRRKRKSSFKYKKKAKKSFGKKITPYDSEKIESIKNYFVDNLKNNKTRKAYHELINLLSYQIKVSPPKQIVKSFCDISQTMINMGQLGMARILLYLSKAFEVNDIVIYSQFAELLKSEGNLKEAKALYEEIKKEFPNDIVAKNGYAEILKSEGKLKEAKALYEEVQKEFPNDIVAKTGYAEILKSEGKLKEAKTLYEDIQKQFPESIVAKNGYAEILKAEGKMGEAKELYKDIQKQFPENIVAKTGYAEILKAEGKMGEAKELYKDIQKQFPENIVAKNGYAEILKSEGNLKEAKALYEKNQKQFPENIVAKTGYAEILKSEGNLKEAKVLYEKAQKQYPESIVAKNGYAEILKAEGRMREAKELYKEIQKQFSYDLYARHALIACYLMDNELNSIDKSFFVTSNPKSQDDYYFYHSFIMYNIKIGELEKAEKLILMEIETVPFFKTKKLFNQTLVYLKLLQKQSKALLDQIDDIFSTDKYDVVDNVFKTHIYSENNMRSQAKEHLDMIKHYPPNSIFYSNAALLSERFDLNGLPRKGLDNKSLDKLIEQEEFKLIGVVN